MVKERDGGRVTKIKIKNGFKQYGGIGEGLNRGWWGGLNSGVPVARLLLSVGGRERYELNRGRGAVRWGGEFLG
jgi:hypothetical protein